MRFIVAVSALSVLVCLAETGRSQQYYRPQMYPGQYGYAAACPGYYRGPLPPYLMGGPAYGYTYPNPWYGYCPYPQGPRSYIAPPYQVAYGPSAVHTHSYYSPMPGQYPYYPQATRVNASPAPKASKGTPLPGKEPQQPAAEKTPSASKQTDPPATATKKTSLWRRLIYW